MDLSFGNQILILGDEHFPLEALARSLPKSEKSLVWIQGQGWLQNSKKNTQQKISPNIKHNFKEALKDWEESEKVPELAILGFHDNQDSVKVIENLKDKFPNIHILKLGAKKSLPALNEGHRHVSWNDFLTESLDKELRLLAFQDKVRDLRKALDKAEHIGILIQGDPDPDSLASALALRKLLRRHSQTASIISFGKATRPENVAMIELLDIQVLQVNEKDLDNYDRLVLVDCQPSFFKNMKIKADVILDHHPPCLYDSTHPLSFVDIREELGATSTLLLNYLLAANIEISQRLATALLYGIKSDTLMLNREVSSLDVEAFSHLYPLISTNTLKKIERPELPTEFIAVLQKALKNYHLINGIVFMPLGKVVKEEWIPQAADFALQFKGARWSIAYGEHNGQMILSARNCGFVEHCGDLFKKIFDPYGIAGGHRSMAKAIIPMKIWRKNFKNLKSHFDNATT